MINILQSQLSQRSNLQIALVPRTKKNFAFRITEILPRRKVAFKIQTNRTISMGNEPSLNDSRDDRSPPKDILQMSTIVATSSGFPATPRVKLRSQFGRGLGERGRVTPWRGVETENPWKLASDARWPRRCAGPGRCTMMNPDKRRRKGVIRLKIRGTPAGIGQHFYERKGIIIARV